MNTAHLHLVLVHIPIVLVPVTACLLTIGLLWNQETLRKLSLVLLVVCGITAGAAFLTGDGAEDILEHASEASEDLIEAHEEAAELVLWLCSITSILSAASLVIGAKPYSQKLNFSVVLAAWLASAVLAYTGYLGGKIRHPEAYSTSQASAEDALDKD